MTTPAPSTRRPARLLGLFFLLPFPAYGVGSTLLDGTVTSHDHVQLALGAVLVLFNSWLVTAIGASFFPVLWPRAEVTAVAYLATRILEALLVGGGAIAYLTLAGLPPEAAGSLGSALLAAKTWAYQLGMITLGVGSLPFCTALLRDRLVPAWLAGLGLAGYAVLALGAVGELAGLPVGLPASLLGGVFELSLGVWLLTKGLNAGAASPDDRGSGSGTPA